VLHPPRARRYFPYADFLGQVSGYGSAPTWGSGVLFGTSIGLARPMVAVLRDTQVALDPSNTSSLRSSWGTWHWQPCAPWGAGSSTTIPVQATAQIGYGRGWMGVGCSDWDGTRNAATNWNGVPSLSLSRIGLSGTVPGAPLCELNATLTTLELSQNALTGTMPPCLGTVPRASSVFLSVYDNLLVGTVPSTYASLSAIALAYNPYLVASLPSGLTTLKLRAWSATFDQYFPAYDLSSAASYGAANYGTGVLRGTSLGHDRPVVHILRDILAALDPTKSSLLTASWRSTDAQPCPPWTTIDSKNPTQLNTTPGYGASWLGVVCGESYTTATPVTLSVPPFAGIVALNLDAMGLSGTLPLQLRELRTLTTLSLVRNVLVGTIPECWGSNVTWAMGAPTPGLDSLAFMDLSLNAITGTLPPSLVALPQASSLFLSVINNQLGGAIPATYTSLSGLAVAFNARLVGTLPVALHQKMYAYDVYYNRYYPAADVYSSSAYGACCRFGTVVLYGTSLGHDRPVVDILRDILAALDPAKSSSLHASWLPADLQPCAPWIGSTSPTNTQWATLPASAPGAGSSWTGVTCMEPLTAAVDAGGGVATLLLPSLGLTGTVSCALSQLKTALTISLAGNALTGVLPAGMTTNLTSLARLDVSANAALCAATTTPATVIKTGTSTTAACTTAAASAPSCAGRVTSGLPSPPPPALAPGDASCSYTPVTWTVATFPPLATAVAACLGSAVAPPWPPPPKPSPPKPPSPPPSPHPPPVFPPRPPPRPPPPPSPPKPPSPPPSPPRPPRPPKPPPAPWYNPGVPADMPTAAVTLSLGGVSAAAVGPAQLTAFTLAVTTALGFAPDALAVSGVAAANNPTHTLVGVVISGDSEADAARCWQPRCWQRCRLRGWRAPSPHPASRSQTWPTWRPRVPWSSPTPRRLRPLVRRCCCVARASTPPHSARRRKPRS
jgi:hypothetical protein